MAQLQLAISALVELPGKKIKLQWTDLNIGMTATHRDSLHLHLRFHRAQSLGCVADEMLLESKEKL